MTVSQVWPEDFAARYRAAGYWRGETLGDMLRRKAASHPARLAVVDEQNRWTYRDLDRRADALARGFVATGLHPGDRVICQLPNSAMFLAVVFGLFRAGIIPVFAMPAHRIEEISHFAAASGARGMVIADRAAGFDYRPLAAQLQRRVPAVHHILVDGEPGPFASLREIIASADDLPSTPAASAVALMQLSGGSTGFSKLIPRTHDDYLYSVRASAELCGLDSHAVTLVVLPAAHNFPLSSPGSLGTLAAGGTVVMAASSAPEAAFPLIAREGVTSVALVPPLALAWIEAATRTTEDLTSLATVQIGGARLDPAIAARVRPTLGARLQQVYGMAEGLVNYTRPDDPDEIVLATQGRPISPADEILVVDPAGLPVADGVPGQLLTRGPYTIRAYHNDPEANAAAFTADGFYRTGDIVARRPDGNLVVHGRANDVINRGGEKISPDEVETHLLAHPQVFDAVLIGIPDPWLGERSCAVIVPRGDAPSAPTIRSFIRGRGVAAFKVPDEIVIVAAFAATAVGKTSRKDLRHAVRAALPETGDTSKQRS